MGKIRKITVEVQIFVKRIGQEKINDRFSSKIGIKKIFERKM